MPQLVAAQGVVNRSSKIRARYVFLFGKYTGWDAKNLRGNTFNIGIVGKTDVVNHLNKLAETNNLKGKNFTVRQINKVADLKNCHIVFFSKDSLAKDRINLLKKSKSLQILTVGETPGFAQVGGMINFFVKNNNTGFEINLSAAKNVDLKISSSVLRLGKIIDVSKDN